MKFIRKRDPRYKAHQAAQKGSVSQPAKTPIGQPSSQTPGTATPLAPAFVAQGWQNTSHGNAADLEWSLAEGGDEEEWECVACGKSFRSEAAWDSHERSKKHLKAVERLAREMAEENDALGLEEDMAALAVEDDEQAEDNSEAVESLREPPSTESARDQSLDVAPGSDDKEMEDERPTGRKAKKMKSNKSSRAPSPSPPRASRNSRRRRNRDAEREPDPSTPPTPPAVGVADPSPSQTQESRGEDAEAAVGVDADRPLMEVHSPDDGESGAHGVQSEISKREKRRAREAAKKAAVSALVVVTTYPLRPVHLEPCTHTQSRISGRSARIAGVLPRAGPCSSLLT